MNVWTKEMKKDDKKINALKKRLLFMTGSMEEQKNILMSDIETAKLVPKNQIEKFLDSCLVWNDKRERFMFKE
jgi:hypothetical protein